MSLLLEVNNVRFSTSREADQHCDSLRERLGLRGRNSVARLAIAKSLSVGTPPGEIPPSENMESCNPIKGDNLFGGDLAVWVALLLQSEGIVHPTRKQIEDLVRRHWRRGANLLAQEMSIADESGSGTELFLTRLAESAAPNAGFQPKRSGGDSRQATVTGEPIRVTIGTDLTSPDAEQAWFTLNAPGWAPHVAIMGGTGSGKSVTAKSFWREIRAQTGTAMGLLIVDPKGDLGQDEALVQDLGATVIRVQRNPVPLDVFGLVGDMDQADAAMRFSESLSRGINGTLGPIQLSRLTQAVQKVLKGSKPHTVAKVFNQLQQAYATESIKDDSLIAGMRQLTAWQLFDPAHPPEQFFGKTWILSLNEANDSVAKLVVSLVTDALYNWMRPLADAPTDAEGHRGIRVILAVDEAHQLLGRKQQSLSKMLKEGRSKGVSVMLMSQSPVDFDGKDCNYLENIGLCLCFRTNVPATQTLRAMWQAKVDTGGLEKGVAVTRLPGEQAVRRLRVWP